MRVIAVALAFLVSANYYRQHLRSKPNEELQSWIIIHNFGCRASVGCSLGRALEASRAVDKEMAKNYADQMGILYMELLQN